MPEAGWHPSNPVVERSWDAVLKRLYDNDRDLTYDYQVRVGTFIYRINSDNDKELQRRSYGSSSWSRVTEFNGYHILDLLLSANGKDIEVYTDRYVCVREYSGNVRRK